MTRTDQLFAAARNGDTEAFGEWMGTVELPIRRRLQRFARVVDVEALLQETFLRMWILARDRERELVGVDASLRYALGMARNLAREEARRLGRLRLLPPEEFPEVSVEPDPLPDAGLRQAILDCIGELPAKPLAALRARLASGSILPDREIARNVGMTLNTFLQNIVRARRQVARCLERKGVVLGEVLP